MVEYLFLATIALLPIQFAPNISDNADFVTTRLFVSIVFLFWLMRGLARKKIWIAARAETWLLLIFLFLSAISLWGGLDAEKGTRKILYLFSIIPLFFVGAALLRKREFQMKAAKAVFLSGLLAAFIGLTQFSLPFFIGLETTLKLWKSISIFFLGNSLGKLVTTNPSWLVNISGETWMRAFGFFPDPHVFSFFVSLCFFSSLGYFFEERNSKWKIATAFGVALMLVSVILSFSRGAYLGMIVGSSFFLFFWLKTKNIFRKAVSIGAVVCIAFVLLFQQTVLQRLSSAFNPNEGSNVERLKNWRQAADIIGDHPFFGVGLGNYALQVDPMSEERSSIYAHNLFLDVAAETGFTSGLIFFVLLLVSIWRGVFSKNMLGLGVASSALYLLVHGIFDTPIWSPQVLVVLMVALAMGVNNVKSQSSNVKT